MTSFAIIGCGALGGLYGAMLHQAGNPVHFLFNSDYEHVREHGLRVDSIWGDLHLTDLNCYQQSTDMPQVDVVCICLKSTHNHLVTNIIKPLLHEKSIILFLQNGIAVEETFSSAFPEHKIAGGLAFLCSNKIGPGHIHHLDYGPVRMGVHVPDRSLISDEIDKDIVSIATLFEAAKIPCTAVADLAKARWQKLVWNIPYNGLCTVMDVDTSVVMQDQHSRQLCKDIMHEIYHAANANDCDIGLSSIDKMLSNTEKMKPYLPSMLLDRRQQRPLELACMYQAPLQMAADKGVAMPLVRMLHAQLSAIDTQTQQQSERK